MEDTVEKIWTAIKDTIIGEGKTTKKNKQKKQSMVWWEVHNWIGEVYKLRLAMLTQETKEGEKNNLNLKAYPTETNGGTMKTIWRI